MGRAWHVEEDKEARLSIRGWLTRGLFAVGAVAVAASLVLLLTPVTWWAQSGLPLDPGVFKARVSIDYPVCASWPRGAGIPVTGIAKGAEQIAVASATTTRAFAGGEDTNLGVLIPTNATVIEVFCATGDGIGRFDECSANRCDPPVTALVEDSLYSGNRALIFSLKNRAPRDRVPSRVRLWVVWTRH
jgi:hypothetical protein